MVDESFLNFHATDMRIIRSATVVLFLMLVIVGMDWDTRIQKVLLVLLVCSQVAF